MRASRIIRQLVRERLVVTLLDGATFDGLLIDADPVTIVLADAQHVAPNGDRLAVDGYLYLDRERVAYVQRPTPNKGARA
jgi:small nuclear ribonucleoprotein (snRNP)-like protein